MDDGIRSEKSVMEIVRTMQATIATTVIEMYLMILYGYIKDEWNKHNNNPIQGVRSYHPL